MFAPSEKMGTALADKRSSAVTHQTSHPPGIQTVPYCTLSSSFWVYSAGGERPLYDMRSSGDAKRLTDLLDVSRKTFRAVESQLDDSSENLSFLMTR